MYALIVIVAIILIIVVWLISISNKFNRCLVKIEEADSGIDVALTKRYDVLTKMIDTVKGYTTHEKETLFEVINLRQGMNLDEKLKENAKMDKNMEKINLLVEQYPDLKASQNFNTLQQSIVEVEEHLQAARRMYNSNVSIYNQLLTTFPNSMIGNIKHLEKKAFFEAEEVKKQDVKIEF